MAKCQRCLPVVNGHKLNLGVGGAENPGVARGCSEGARSGASGLGIAPYCYTGIPLAKWLLGCLYNVGGGSGGDGCAGEQGLEFFEALGHFVLAVPDAREAFAVGFGEYAIVEQQ